MGINVQNQNAGVVNNVEGTQNNYGPQSGTVTVTIGQVRAAVQSLGEALRDTPMPDDARRAALDHVRAVDDEVQTPQPDKRRVADRLESLGSLLRGTGSVVTAGSALLGPLKTIAAWLGPLAAPLVGLLL
jgi:hypothetical protein